MWSAYSRWHLLRIFVGGIAFRIAILTETIVDDLIVDALRPFRFVYALPVAVGFLLASMAEPYAYEMRLVTGALLIVLVVDTAIKLLSGIGAVIRQTSGARVSTTAYIDLLKIVAVVLGFAVAVSVMTETDLLKLLGGIGAFAAVLIFIFKDTATDSVEKLIVI